MKVSRTIRLGVVSAKEGCTKIGSVQEVPEIPCWRDRGGE
jgi:hypothetical protein